MSLPVRAALRAQAPVSRLTVTSQTTVTARAIANTVTLNNVADKVKDTAKTVDRAASDVLLKGIEATETVAGKVKNTSAQDASKEAGKMYETAKGEAQGTMETMKGKADGGMAEAAGTAKGAYRQAKGTVGGAMNQAEGELRGKARESRNN